MPKPKKQYSIPKMSAKKLAKEKAEKEERGGEKTSLEKWYDMIMDLEEGVCWETGDKINKKDRLGWHGSISHIFSKKLFPSVATHQLNYLILSMWNGSHGTFDSSWERASKMKVWRIAVNRMIVIFPNMPQKEKRRIPDWVIELIDK